jgi:membrane protein implicated in regulation of membrane protease activity
MLYVRRFWAAFGIGIPFIIAGNALSLTPDGAPLALVLYVVYLVAMAIWAYARANDLNAAAGLADVPGAAGEQQGNTGREETPVKIGEHTWKCSCGEINLKSAGECRVCGRPRA